MNQHLQAVRAQYFTIAQPAETDIVSRQAQLMQIGSNVLQTLSRGENTDMLRGLTVLAYCALDALAQQRTDIAI